MLGEAGAYRKYFLLVVDQFGRLRQMYREHEFHQSLNILPANIRLYARASSLRSSIAFLALKKSIISSIGTLPTSLSSAMGQPPKPFRAPSKRVQPAFNAASVLICQAWGAACKCTPVSIFG